MTTGRTFQVKDQKAALGEIVKLVRKSQLDPAIVLAARQITSDCPARDDMCELQAIYNAVKNGDPRVKGLEKGVRYLADSTMSDVYTSPSRLLKDCEAGGCAEDCLPPETLVVGAGYQLKPIGSLKVGDAIMGDGGWTTVTSFWDKGVQDLLEIDLGTGGILRCTAGHKLFRVRKNPKGYAGVRGDTEEVRAGDIKVGDDLLLANKLPVGQESLDEGKAWLLGVHIADGWADDMGMADGVIRRASISGKDGHRKEAQKRRVQEICARLGVETNWQERWITIKDVALAQWLAGAGKHAVNKHVPSLNFDETTLRAVLEGLSADATQRDSEFGTVSPLLAVQLRVMHRMLGIKTSIRKIDEHGGLGKNPIYRVQPFGEDATRRRPHGRVQSISAGGESPTVDIEVVGSKFYLPETDLIVHNCDGHTALICALAGACGFTTALRAYAPIDSLSSFGNMNDGYTHVYAGAFLPKRAGEDGQFTALDTTVPRATVGWQPPKGRVMTAIVTPEGW